MFCQTSFAQQTTPTDNPEYTGENFSLEGALALFKKSNSLEEFEKLINEENNNVNNLDLNGDGETDFVTVESLKEGDTHVIVLKTFLNDKEKQDIATIGIEKTGKEEAILQIEGDEELYAANTIVEPAEIDEKLEKSKGGPSTYEYYPIRQIVNVWFWPSVRYLYAPVYVVRVSPYRYGYYPPYWKPWRAQRYTIFYGRNNGYRNYYHRTPTHRVVIAKKVYAPRRNYSTVVVHKNRRTTVIKQGPARNSKVVRSTRPAPKAKVIKKGKPTRGR